MELFFKKNTLVTGLAIFAMFFGAGNLIFAINVGKLWQNQTPLALLGFLLSGVCLPVVGICAILLFEGDYKAFFGRIGKVPGFLLCLFCLAIAGPFVAMPRIVTLSHTVVSDVFPSLGIGAFSIIFLSIIFLLSMSENRIIDVIGRFISPLLLVALSILFAWALMSPGQTHPVEAGAGDIMIKNLQYGYNTLDFLTAPFFASIVISILRRGQKNKTGESARSLVRFGLVSSIVGMVILGLVYAGLATIGALHGGQLGQMNEAEVFSAITHGIMGTHGALLVNVVVLSACISTIIALSALTAEYIKEHLFAGKLPYRAGLIIALSITGIFSVMGLSHIIEFSKPFIGMVYPVVIVLAVVNILYAKFGFRPVRAVVFACLALSVWFNVYGMVKQKSQNQASQRKVAMVR